MSWLDPVVLTTVGLALDVLGVILLFFFTIDKNRGKSETGPGLVWVTTDDPNDPEVKKNKRRFKKYVSLMNAGFTALILGFLLQMTAVWI